MKLIPKNKMELKPNKKCNKTRVLFWKVRIARRIYHELFPKQKMIFY